MKLRLPKRNSKPRPANRTKRKVILGNIVAAFTLILFLGGAIVYDQYISPVLHDVTIWVAAANITPNTLLTKQNTQPLSFSRDKVEAGAITDPSQIWGKRATQQINARQPITAKDMETDPLVPTAGQAVFPIPNSWIYQVDGGLRAGDAVRIFAYPRSTTTGAPTQAGTTKAAITSNQAAPSTVAPIVFNVPVVVEYVRSGNQEVVNAASTTKQPDSSIDARASGSAVPSNLSLLLTNDQFQTLAQLSLTNQFEFAYPYN